jgi:hypothetical protein
MAGAAKGDTSPMDLAAKMLSANCLLSVKVTTTAG